MRIDHIALWSNDIERLKEFYSNYFNARPNKKYENSQKRFQSYFLSFDDGARLELMQMPNISDNKNDPAKQYCGYVHFCVSIGSEQNVIELTNKLKDDGFTVISEPRRTGDGYFESCILDPDNNRVEITT
jgi:lactoylglutathione lyase